METEVTKPAGIMDEILSTPVEEITRGQWRRWQDELFARSQVCTTDEEWEYCGQLSDALGSKLCELIENAPKETQDKIDRMLPSKEEWAAGIADDIKMAREDGQWRAAQLGEEMLQQAFDAGTIRKH